jgi:glyoxylase-like metal-dependent hydrolase (beta-lactamase superfamily II)
MAPVCLRAGLVAAAVLACLKPAAAQEYAAVTVPMELVQVAPHTYYVRGQSGMVSNANQGFNSNAGFVVTRDGIVVFDALGTPALGRALLERIRSVSAAPIHTVVISHYHADHFYGLAAFKAAGPVDVVARREVRDYLATGAAGARLDERRQSLAPWVNRRTTVIGPDRYLARAQTSFTLGGVTFRLLHAGPAHTPEDLVMLVEEEGVLFAGDVIVAGRVPFVGDAEIAPWLAAIERLAAFRPKVLVAGHGEHSNAVASDMLLTKNYLLHLRRAMRRAVDQGVDFLQAYAGTDWSAYNKLPAFDAANRNNAFNAYLAAERDSLAAPADKP